ncbi:MAG TPA: LLM class F420-dependent oxidoreductase [Solirubrobacteraceae bacterium]|nr:LLM class F420-dependent oxidoreductase [Solirubrobacteraceae bacterium]
MKFGLATFPTDYAMGPAELARAAEEHGFESLFVTEHTHIPASRETPYPGGTELPKEYSHTLDPFVALGAAAAVTTRLRLGTGICLVVERDPITTAKEVATLDHLSGGRFLFGVGAGWNREEMRDHGTDPRERFDILRERVLAMKQLWTAEEASFHGEHVGFERAWAWPKPAQQPHPPVLVGGIGAKVLDRVLEYGDEWMPNDRDLSRLAPRIAELRRRAQEAGRGRIPVTYFGALGREDVVESLIEAGVDRCLFILPPVEADENLPRIERYAQLAARYAG